MITRIQAWLSSADRAPALTASVVGIAAVAWLGVILLHDTLHGTLNARVVDAGYAQFVAELPPNIIEALRYCSAAPNIQGPGFFNWIMGWALMTLAMMLPPALPLWHALQRLTAEHVNRARLLVMAICCFVLVWLLAGITLYSVGSLAQMGIQLWPALASKPALLAGAAAILVGAYQFTPLKMACLTACRSPASVIMTQWHSDTPLRSAACIGVCYGAVCVGCCWALMLLSVLVGAMMLPIMAATAVIMMMERLLPSVRRLMAAQASLAIAIGFLLIAGALPVGFHWG